MKLNKVQKKKAIMARMLVGGNANEIGEEFNTSPLTINKWMRDELTSDDQDEVIDLISVNPVVLTAVADEVKRKASSSTTITTKQLDKLDREIDKVTKGVVGLQMLEAEFHDSIMKMLVWANNKITDDMKISEWTQLVNGISTLHTALFSKGSNTQINLMQNNGGGASSAKVDKFRGGFRV